QRADVALALQESVREDAARRTGEEIDVEARRRRAVEIAEDVGRPRPRDDVRDDREVLARVGPAVEVPGVVHRHGPAGAPAEKIDTQIPVVENPVATDLRTVVSDVNAADERDQPPT